MKNLSFQAEIIVTGLDKFGMIKSISKVITADMEIDMRSISVNIKDGLSQGTVPVLIKDIKHLDESLTNIKKIKDILKAERLNPNTG